MGFIKKSMNLKLGCSLFARLDLSRLVGFGWNFFEFVDGRILL